MARLRDVLAAQGCERVRTYIASGNAVLASDVGRAELARRLERAIHDEFGVETPVVLRTADEMAGVLERHPFGEDAAHTHVAFLAEEPDAARVEALAELDVAPDRIVVDGLEAYWYLPGGMQGAQLSGARLEKELGVAATIRNWRTVVRLAEMAAEQ
jgi:uncharacterized protein (DUF1697 family)